MHKYLSYLIGLINYLNIFPFHAGLPAKCRNEPDIYTHIRIVDKFAILKINNPVVLVRDDKQYAAKLFEIAPLSVVFL